MFRKIVQFKNGKYGLRELTRKGWAAYDLRLVIAYPHKYGYPWPISPDYCDAYQFDSIEILYNAMKQCKKDYLDYKKSRKIDIGTPYKEVSLYE